MSTIKLLMNAWRPRTATSAQLFLVVLLVASVAISSAPAADFRRGDSNADSAEDISDAIHILGFLFVGSPAQIPCRDAADVNDDGSIDIADPIYLLSFLFVDGQPPPLPSGSCGNDPTPDGLDCVVYFPCIPPPPESIRVTPLDLDFGCVGVGVTSPPLTVTFTNQGTALLTNFAGGSPADTQFSASQNCAGGVAPGASCQYSFRLTPNATGEFETVSTTSTSAGPIVIRLRGTGVGASLTASPLELDFGNVVLHTSSEQQVVTIRNTGLARLESFAGGLPPDTQFSGSQNCASGVALGASCQYFFRFTPTKSGVFETTSTTSTNAGSFVVRLRGRGVSPPFPSPLVDKTVTPLELDFGPVGLGVTSPPQAVTIRSTSSSTLTDFAGGVPFDTQFSASQNCAGGVAPGASCQYFFRFTPTKLGSFETTSESSTNAGPFVIRLRGRGVGPKLWVTPLELDFGTVPVGVTSPPQAVTITNLGLSTLESFVGGVPPDAQFTASQNCASGVAPGASCQYFFRFTPTAVGAFEATSNSSTNAGSFAIRLRGRGE